MRRKLIKHIILIAIFSIAVLNVSISVFAASVNESESNNTFSTADTIVLGDSCSGNIGDSDDKDYYKITPTSNG